MRASLLTTGITCIVAAISAAGVTTSGLTIPAIPTLDRQVLLAAFGVVLVGMAWVAENGAHAATSAMPRPPLGLLIVGGALVGLGEVVLFMLVFIVLKGVLIGFEGGPARMMQRLQQEPSTAVALLVGAALGAIVGWLIHQRAGRAAWLVVVAGGLIGIAVAWLFPADVAPVGWTGTVQCGALGLALGLVVAWRIWRLGW